MGFLAPGFKEVGDFFTRGYAEAEADPEKWGCKSCSDLIH